MSENGRSGRFGKPAKPSAPKGRRFGRLRIDSRCQLQNSESEANLLVLLPCCQALEAFSYFSTGNIVLARMNLKPDVLKDFAFSAKSTVFRIWIIWNHQSNTAQITNNEFMKHLSHLLLPFHTEWPKITPV